jgi:hypothetical protein
MAVAYAAHPWPTSSGLPPLPGRGCPAETILRPQPKLDDGKLEKLIRYLCCWETSSSKLTAIIPQAAACSQPSRSGQGPGNESPILLNRSPEFPGEPQQNRASRALRVPSDTDRAPG